MSDLQTHYHHFKLDFQKLDQHTGGKWLIDVTKHHKDNQYPIFKENVQGHKRSGRRIVVETELSTFRKPKYVVRNQ